MESRKGFRIIMVLDFILLIAAFIGNLGQLFMIKEMDIYLFISFLLKVLAIVFALLYSFLGYRKNAAIFFHLFVVIYTLSAFLVAIQPAVPGTNAVIKQIAKTSIVLIFGCLSILSVAKDLGKTKSFILVIIIMICALICMIISPVKKHTILVGPATDLILAFVMGVMIYAKYKDKTERGTK